MFKLSPDYTALRDEKLGPQDNSHIYFAFHARLAERD